jgi:PAS domain S-box-containing protein
MFDGNDCLLKVSDITKRLNDYFTLSNVSIDLNRGEVQVLLGENGAGKTTLVKLLTGGITPDRGRISILGKEVKIKNPQHARSLGISVAHQDFILFPGMSVVANLCLFQDPSRGSLTVGNTDVERAKYFLSELDFLAKVNLRDKVSNLSAGQRKQLQIASAIIQNAPILILDDPTSYLSDEERACLFEVINGLKNQGKGILYACHRVDEAKRVADRVVVLRDGEIATSIEDKSLVSSANLLRGMIGVIFRLRPAPGLPIERVSTNVELELGYRPEALMDSRYEDIIHLEDRQKAEDLRLRFAEQGVDHFEREYRITCASGEHKWVHELAHVVRDGGGAITSYEIGIVDITEARRAQEALRQSERKYESLVNNIADIIYSSVPGDSGTRIFLSPRWEDWTGQSIHDIYRDGQIWLRAVHREDADKVTKVYQEASTKGTDYCIEYRLVHKDSGQVRHVRDHGVPIKEGGRLLMFDGIISDITEVKNLEVELRQSREFLSELIMNAPIPILVFNEDHSVRYANPALERLTGFDGSEIIGYSFPYPWYVNKQRHSQPDELTGPREELYQKENGDRFWVEIASVVVEDQLHEKFFLETWNDITREKQFTENLRSYANLVTSALEDERKRLARELHDGTIQSLFCLCTDIGNCIKDSRLPPDVRQELELILDRTGVIMNSVRSFCHEMRPDIIDRFGLVPAIKLLVEEMNQHDGLTCQFDIIGDMQRLRGDSELTLFRIIQEALNNVRRHASATEVKLNVIFADSVAKIIIADNGVGFKVPDEINALASYGKLGLVGMNERAYLIGGTLVIDSKMGEGTTITVQVPLLDGDAVSHKRRSQDGS